MRSQSALEFLSTYSWAFLIITIFLASMYLIAFAPTGPSTYVPSSCYITPTLPCYQSVLLANSSGSKFITLFQNNMGVGIHFPANSIYVHPSFSSNAVYVGSCLPRTAPPGATVVCNVTLAAFKPSIGSQVNPTFTLSYQICPSCNTTAALVYNTSGTSTVTASSSASALYEVQLVTSPSTGNIVISGVRYPSGANVIFIAGVDYPIYAISPSGYAFGGWILSNVIVGNAMQQYTTATGGINSDPAACIQACSYPFVTSTSTTTIPVYTLTMNAGTGGYVTPSSGSYPSGNTVSITATPLTGYAFSSWTGTGSGSYSGASSSASVTMNGDVTETASFAPQSYGFSASAGTGGTISVFTFRLHLRNAGDRDCVSKRRLYLLKLDLQPKQCLLHDVHITHDRHNPCRHRHSHGQLRTDLVQQRSHPCPVHIGRRHHSWRRFREQHVPIRRVRLPERLDRIRLLDIDRINALVGPVHHLWTFSYRNTVYRYLFFWRAVWLTLVVQYRG